jgi:cysteine desulfurase
LVAEAINCNRSEVVFTSGGTEANNQAIKGLYWSSGKKLIVSSPLEHHAVLDPIQWLESEQGAEVYWLKFDRLGQLDISDLEAILATRGSEVALIALMLVNNETGVITDIAAVTKLASKYNIAVHCDAVAALGNVSLDFATSGLSTMAISGHKVGAPIGVGALIVDRGIKPTSLLHGGSQERALRSGTLSYPLISSFGAAVSAAEADRPQRTKRLAELRDRLETLVLEAIPAAVSTVSAVARTSHHAHLIFPGAQSDNLLFLLDQAGVSASAGSACTAGVLAPSHVLIGMGISEELADCAIRATLGHSTQESDIEAFVQAIKTAYPIAVLEAANQKAI